MFAKNQVHVRNTKHLMGFKAQFSEGSCGHILTPAVLGFYLPRQNPQHLGDRTPAHIKGVVRPRTHFRLICHAAPEKLTSSPTFPTARMGTGMQICTHMTYPASGFLTTKMLVASLNYWFQLHFKLVVDHRHRGNAEHSWGALHQNPELLISQSTEVSYPDLLEPVNALTSSLGTFPAHTEWDRISLM